MMNFSCDVCVLHDNYAINFDSIINSIRGQQTTFQYMTVCSEMMQNAIHTFMARCFHVMKTGI